MVQYFNLVNSIKKSDHAVAKKTSMRCTSSKNERMLAPITWSSYRACRTSYFFLVLFAFYAATNKQEKGLDLAGGRSIRLRGWLCESMLRYTSSFMMCVLN